MVNIYGVFSLLILTKDYYTQLTFSLIFIFILFTLIGLNIHMYKTTAKEITNSFKLSKYEKRNIFSFLIPNEIKFLNIIHLFCITIFSITVYLNYSLSLSLILIVLQKTIIITVPVKYTHYANKIIERLEKKIMNCSTQELFTIDLILEPLKKNQTRHDNIENV